MRLKNGIAKYIKSTALQRRIMRRKGLDRFFAFEGLLVMGAALLVLFTLVGQLAADGAGRLSWQFLTSFPSRFPAQAGVLTAWIGTILVMLVTALAAIP